MKTMKKLMTLVLSIAMVLALGVTTFAAEAGSASTYTITAPATNHKYEIYQIFTGDLSGTTLSNVKWGVNGTGKTGELVSEAIINTLTDVNSKSDREKLDVIEQYATLKNPVATITNGEGYSVAAGYYLIKDKDGSVSGTDTYTTYIVQVVGNVTIAPKSDVPSFEKKVKDTNDTEGDTSGWQDSADYDIGDEVPFKLEGTVSSKYDDYKTYYFAFHDKEEAGLTFNPSSVKVYVDNATEALSSDYYTVKTEHVEESCTFEVIFENLKKVKAVGAGSKIRVEYTSTLNGDAVTGNTGNVNKAKLEFSNNPNQTQGGTPETGETPWDNVIVFTYKLEVNKVDENNVALPGAAFELKKKVKTTNENGELVDTYVRVALINATENNGKYTLIDGTQTTFTWRGIDDGAYELSEVITPSGYNTIAPITFTVTADHTITWNGGERTDLLTSLTGSVASGEITFAASEDKSSLSTNIINKSGSTLPSTGGMGTTIFYVVGTILVLAAVVLLITKKRMHADK